MARRTKTTTTTKDSGGKYSGKFSGAVSKVRASGSVSNEAGTTPQAIKNVQNEIYSYFQKDQNTGAFTPYPVDTGLDTDTN